MSHSGAYYRQRYIVVAGSGRPAVARAVRRQVGGKSCFCRQYFEIFIIAAKSREVLFIRLRLVCRPDDRKYIGAVIRLLFISFYDFTHTGFYVYSKSLSCLASRIIYHVILYVFFAQECYIYKCHASCTVAENENVAGEGKFGRTAKVDMFEPQYSRLVDGSFACAVYTRVNTPKRVCLWGEFLLDGFVIHSAKHPQVER